MKKVQTDTSTVLARKIQGAVKKHVRADSLDENARKAYDLLLAWDGNSAKDSAAASIYNTFYVRFASQTLVDELGEELAAEDIGERYISMERFLDMVEKRSAFFDDYAYAGEGGPRGDRHAGVRRNLRAAEKALRDVGPGPVDMGHNARHTLRPRTRKVGAVPAARQLRSFSVRRGRRDEQ